MNGNKVYTRRKQRYISEHYTYGSLVYIPMPTETYCFQSLYFLLGVEAKGSNNTKFDVS